MGGACSNLHHQGEEIQSVDTRVEGSSFKLSVIELQRCWSDSVRIGPHSAGGSEISDGDGGFIKKVVIVSDPWEDSVNGEPREESAVEPREGPGGSWRSGPLRGVSQAAGR